MGTGGKHQRSVASRLTIVLDEVVHDLTRARSHHHSVVGHCAMLFRIIDQELRVFEGRIPGYEGQDLVSELLFAKVLEHFGLHPLRTSTLMELLVLCDTVARRTVAKDFNAFGRCVRFYRSLMAGRIGVVNAVKAPQLQWTGRGRLEELVHQLMERGLATGKSTVFAFFDAKGSASTSMKWDFDRKDHLVLLLRGLYAGGFVRAIHGKGYYSYAEERVIGFRGERFRPQALKRRGHVLRVEPERHAKVMAEVEEILSAIAIQGPMDH